MQNSIQGGAFFAHYKLPKQKETAPKALSREDFEKLRDLHIPETRQSHIITRDLFLFACYSGTAYADVLSITNENLFTDETGSLWLKYHRRKTEYRARVKLLPEAIELIDKYRDDKRGTLFPVQEYHTLRSNMKALRIMADISQDLVYHVSRHSNLSFLLKTIELQALFLQQVTIWKRAKLNISLRFAQTHKERLSRHKHTQISPNISD